MNLQPGERIAVLGRPLGDTQIIARGEVLWASKTVVKVVLDGGHEMLLDARRIERLPRN